MPTGNEHLFDEAIDDATHMVIEAFTWANLPEGDELSNLMVRINDALTNLSLIHISEPTRPY